MDNFYVLSGKFIEKHSF